MKPVPRWQPSGPNRRQRARPSASRQIRSVDSRCLTSSDGETLLNKTIHKEMHPTKPSPATAMALNCIPYAHYKTGSLDKALDAILHAIRLDSGNWVVCNNAAGMSCLKQAAELIAEGKAVLAHNASQAHAAAAAAAAKPGPTLDVR
ncbi:unnamed protein product [Vitrella brassicaformis CCMP3155]|uniref:Uncharacterized protein n=1 Tax=Vitrella brassicaformis (strain CCMP3155) TaxID=1169540 RepID=A0A0G4EDB4_VITBC|nr:unnamed protein product [Vitrella brassicaformis CCMP3155]|eukprot:CEL93679.1 unnamed protein product [Vitrella brassicaformis CCMP3155]